MRNDMKPIFPGFLLHQLSICQCLCCQVNHKYLVAKDLFGVNIEIPVPISHHYHKFRLKIKVEV